jgi:inorganic pyrophosphatase
MIDRPAGTSHPRYPDFIYPLDYGYLQDTQAMDQGGVDVWVGSLPGRQVTGVICTVDLSKRDTEIKILLGCTDAEARTILAMHNSGSQSGILITRNSSTP